MFAQVVKWAGDHPSIVIAAIAALTVALVAAMYFGYDLSWIPALLQRLVGWQ